MSHFLISEIHLLVKQDRFSQTCQDLWYVHRNDLSNHLWKADLGVERLGLDKKVKCELMEFLYRLKEKKNANKRHHLKRIYYKQCFDNDSGNMTHQNIS